MEEKSKAIWVRSASQSHKISSWGKLGTTLPLISKINRFSHFRYYSNICGFKKKIQNQPVAEPLGLQCHCNACFKPKWKSLKVRRFQEALIKVRGDYSGTIEVKEKVTVTGLMTNFWFIHSLKQLCEKLGKYVKGQVGKATQGSDLSNFPHVKELQLQGVGEEFQEFYCPAPGTSMPHTESQLRWITTFWVQCRVSRDQYLLSGCRIISLLQDQGVGSSTVSKPCSARTRIYGKVSGKWRKSREAERAVCVLQVRQRTACEDEL